MYHKICDHNLLHLLESLPSVLLWQENLNEVKSSFEETQQKQEAKKLG